MPFHSLTTRKMNPSWAPPLLYYFPRNVSIMTRNFSNSSLSFAARSSRLISRSSMCSKSSISILSRSKSRRLRLQLRAPCQILSAALQGQTGHCTLLPRVFLTLPFFPLLNPTFPLSQLSSSLELPDRFGDKDLATRARPTCSFRSSFSSRTTLLSSLFFFRSFCASIVAPRSSSSLLHLR